MAYVPLTAALLEPLQPEHRDFLSRIHDQAVRSGIDYKTLGQSWDHPTARISYRHAQGASFQKRSSQDRQRESHVRIESLAHDLAQPALVADIAVAEERLVSLFCTEIGAPAAAANATFAGASAAVAAELLLPLRSLNEGIEQMTFTFNRRPVPREPVQAAVDALTSAVLANIFSDWRYTNPVGRRQLEGLSDAQVATWREPKSVTHSRVLRTHEDAPGELGLFWATKIGGPSHGFDIEGQCLLPLLCNARHKVILVSDAAWPHHPAGRAHFRLLWLHGTSPPRPVLWLETVNADFEARVNTRDWLPAVLAHAVSKAREMGVALSIEAHLERALADAAQASGGGTVASTSDAYVLRPSNGVLEASDYLTRKHDWVQMEEEVTTPLRRALFTPSTRDEL